MSDSAATGITLIPVRLNPGIRLSPLCVPFQHGLRINCTLRNVITGKDHCSVFLRSVHRWNKAILCRSPASMKKSPSSCSQFTSLSPLHTRLHNNQFLYIMPACIALHAYTRACSTRRVQPSLSVLKWLLSSLSREVNGANINS